MKERPRISVKVITYNQEDVIHRTMDSLLKQKDFIYEICINDDCSQDKTFEILQVYERQHPGLVKPVRNEHNLGICQNIEATQARLTGDIIYDIAGDDVCPDGYFQAVLEFINSEGIDWKNELFTIYSDYCEIEPDGNQFVYKNNLVKKYDTVRMNVRKMIGNRATCYSKKVLDRFEKVADDRTYNAEFAQEIQLALFSEKNYYLPVLGNIYYAGIGISSKADNEKTRMHLQVGYDKLFNFLEKHDVRLSKKDLAYVEFMRCHHLNDRFTALKYFIKSIDFSLGYHGLGLGRIAFVISKRIRRALR